MSELVNLYTNINMYELISALFLGKKWMPVDLNSSLTVFLKS